MEVVDVETNLKKVLKTIPSTVQLVAVSKFRPIEYIEIAYKMGQRCFGESIEQELRQKVQSLPKDIRWHFIGHLQRNKVKYIVPYISMIESVDSFRLLEEINKQAEKHGRIINVLLEIHVAKEESKYGFSPEECLSFLANEEWKNLKYVRICGLMGMASFVNDDTQIVQEFQSLSQLFDKCKDLYFQDVSYFTQKSWGMSDDYLLAIENGANMIRIGSTIFGKREYR